MVDITNDDIGESNRLALWEMMLKLRLVEKKAYDLFQIRMFKHFDDNLFTTSYALREGKKMHKDAELRLGEIQEIINEINMKD